MCADVCLNIEICVSDRLMFSVYSGDGMSCLCYWRRIH